MTEKTQEPHVEEDDDELDGKLNYKPPPQKTLQELQELDKDDESLAKYKKSLLGDGPVVVGRLGHADGKGLGRCIAIVCCGDGTRWTERRDSMCFCCRTGDGGEMHVKEGALSIRCKVTRECWNQKGTCVGLGGLLRG